MDFKPIISFKTICSKTIVYSGSQRRRFVSVGGCLMSVVGDRHSRRPWLVRKWYYYFVVRNRRFSPTYTDDMFRNRTHVNTVVCICNAGGYSIFVYIQGVFANITLTSIFCFNDEFMRFLIFEVFKTTRRLYFLTLEIFFTFWECMNANYDDVYRLIFFQMRTNTFYF